MVQPNAHHMKSSTEQRAYEADAGSSAAASGASHANFFAVENEAASY
jgi:hypothetical protein